MAKRKTTRTPKVLDKFSSESDLSGEWEKPRPGKVDAEGASIALILSRLSGRAQTGFVVDWRPPWAKGLGIEPFHYCFFEDKLLVDTFSRPESEIGFEENALTRAEQQQVNLKLDACRQNGWLYIAVAPDEELTGNDIAAKMNLFNARQAKKESAEEDL